MPSGASEDKTRPYTHESIEMQKLTETKFSRHTKANEVVRGLDLTDKTYLITGATSGLGQEVAKVLAEEGAHVVMAIRDLKKGDVVRQEIYGNTHYRKIDLIRVDLLDLESVVEAAKEFIRNGWLLHGLILNAGSYAPNPGFNEIDVLNSTFQTNYLSHFCLTILLRDVLIKSAPSRVVSLASVMTKYLHLNPRAESLEFLSELVEMGGRGARKYHQYAKSKLCNVMFMKKLHKDLNTHGVSTYSVDPGSFINTRIAAENYGCIRELVCVMVSPFAKEISEGAANIIFAAAHPSAEAFSGKNIVNHKAEESSIHKTANNETFQDALYNRSFRMVQSVLVMRKMMRLMDATLGSSGSVVKVIECLDDHFIGGSFTMSLRKNQDASDLALKNEDQDEDEVVVGSHKVLDGN